MDSNCAEKSIEIGAHGSNDLDYFGIVACRLFPVGSRSRLEKYPQ
jgi:hypothetical protein